MTLIRYAMYQCDLCKAKYTRKSSLAALNRWAARHRKKVHPDHHGPISYHLIADLFLNGA